jgi:hypothetical protein
MIYSRKLQAKVSSVRSRLCSRFLWVTSVPPSSVVDALSIVINHSARSPRNRLNQVLPLFLADQIADLKRERSASSTHENRFRSRR